MGYLDGFRVTFRKLFEERLTRDYSKDKGGKRVKPVRLHGRHGQLPAHHRAGIEVVGAGAIAQGIQVHVSIAIARKRIAAAALEQGPEAQLERDGRGLDH